jgi:hypothetical protein
MFKALEKFKAAAQRHTKSLLDEMEIKVPDEVQKMRMDICLSCEKLYKPTTSCKLCGCFMSVKTYMPQQKCPIDKWQKYDDIKDEEV